MLRLALGAVLFGSPLSADLPGEMNEIEVLRWYSPSYSETVWFDFEHIDVTPPRTLGDHMDTGQGYFLLNCVAYDEGGNALATSQADPTSGRGAFRYLGQQLDDIDNIRCRLEEL